MRSRRSSSPRLARLVAMHAFATPPALPLGATRLNSASCGPRRPPVAVLENPVPKTLDEVVRGWFSPASRDGEAAKSAIDAEAGGKLLSSAISGPQASTVAAAHYLLSTTIVARKDAAGAMASLLVELSASAADGGPERGLLHCAVNQSPDDPACFIVFERFSGPQAMTEHQQGEVYQKFIRAAQPLLEKPLGVYICKEIGGKISLAYHPFGPAGTFGLDARAAHGTWSPSCASCLTCAVASLWRCAWCLG
jgi:quinol monooxygenase YgiN